ncbi:MAG: hypothetical protein A3J97_08185 [Spirochaetes bacterium RIFOXYC1_FULL_54_7]|nr:MAG: hypothetical protein A3J97_08185 [Spirochaetes bacterium RIFOXYC1_FULL_54_7]
MRCSNHNLGLAAVLNQSIHRFPERFHCMPDIPVLVQVLIIFALVVAATAKKVHLGLAASIGGVVFALWRGLGPVVTIGAIGTELANPDTLLLLVLVTFIMVFAGGLKNSGALARFSSAVLTIAPTKKASIVLTPILFGTLPMPGGAALSAPLVDALDADRSYDNTRLSAANYWFRHVLELAWPLYPSFILTSSLTGISTQRLVLINLYAVPVLIVMGMVFVFGKAGKVAVPPGIAEARPGESSNGVRGAAGKPASAGSRLSSALSGFAPLVMVIGIFLAMDALWRALAPGMGLSPVTAALIGRYGPVILGLVAGSVYVDLHSDQPGCFRGTLNMGTLKLAGVLVGIRIFSALLSAGNVAAASAAELAAMGVSPILVVMILPFMAGLATGIGFGYVGLSYPILLGLFPLSGQGDLPREAAVVLAGTFGWAGMMLSPLHVCMVVTAEHFRTGLAATIRRFIVPLSLYVLVALAYVTLLTRLLSFARS